jgi:tetratricopeptide (TPR) repeat protein
VPATPSREYTPYPTATAMGPADELSLMMYRGDYAQAVLFLDEMIQMDPDDANAYFLRATSYYYLTYNQRILTEYETDIYRALDDIDKAIALDPLGNGDYYHMRYEIYSRIAQISTLRIEYETRSAIAADNLRRALELGASSIKVPYQLPLVLVAAGRCQEALDEAWRLERVLLPADAPSASLLIAIAVAEECLGHYERALSFVDKADAVHPGETYDLDRAVLLYGLGRLDEAEAILDMLIADDPYYGGYRYFLRALIHYEMGLKDLALEDTQSGYANTWGDMRIAATMRGLFALDEGDEERALYEFQYAEITTPHDDRPLHERALRDLASIGAKPLTEPEAMILMPTPMPPLARSDRVSAAKPPPGLPSDYVVGCGELNLAPDSSLTAHYVAKLTSPVRKVKWLKLWVLVDVARLTDQVRVFLWSPKDNFWVPMVLGNGIIDVPEPQRFVLPTGDVLVGVLEMKNEYVTVGNILPSMEVVLQNGETVQLGRPPVIERSP